jgi:small nuclear ribonucleoprotein (snRNP)-like protein
MAINDSGFGLELIERAALKILYNELNTELAVIEATWIDEDLELNQLIGSDPIQVELELIEDGNFYQGHVPSLIEASIDKYPNVAVTCDTADPAEQESDYDQFNNYTNSLGVEIMCKSLYNEIEVNRRTTRTLEAVHNVMMRNTTLDGTIEGFDKDPSAILTDVFTRSDRTQGENDWYWRAGRIDYQITRQAKIPEN